MSGEGVDVGCLKGYSGISKTLEFGSPVVIRDPDRERSLRKDQDNGVERAMSHLQRCCLGYGMTRVGGVGVDR